MPLDTISPKSLSAIFSPYNDNTSSLLSKDDWNFITEISDKFPERRPTILQRFQIFEMLEPQKRPACAIEFLKHLPRAGFVERKFDLDTIESIYDHSRLMRHMINEIFNDKALCDSIGIDNNTKNRRIALRLALVHDVAEALTTDFTPTDMTLISRDDKTRMEDLACSIIFAQDPKMLRMIERYEHKDTNIDRLNKVVDVLEGLVDCAVMDTKGHFFTEWNKTAIRMLTPYPDMMDAFATKAIENIKRAFEGEEIFQISCLKARRVSVANMALKAA